MDKEIKNLVSELKKYKKVMSIILFGSYAKNQVKPLSDIDIAIIIKDNDKETETEVATYSSNKLDVAPFHRLPLYIQFEVLKYGKVLFVKNEDYFMEIKRQVLREYLDNTYLYKKIGRGVLA